MDINQRLSTVESHELCENCLRDNHVIADCMKESVCSGVKGCCKRHTKFLHVDIAKVSNSNVVTSVVPTFMPVVPVMINNMFVYALLDAASTGSFCTRSLVQHLGIEGRDICYDLST